MILANNLNNLSLLNNTSDIDSFPLVTNYGITSASVSWSSIKNVIDYSVYLSGSQSSYTLITNTHNTNINLSGLTPSTQYNIKILPNISGGTSWFKILTNQTPDRIIQLADIMPAAYSNAMLSTTGTPPAEGLISAGSGRTYAGQFNTQSYNEQNARKLKTIAVRFLFMNLHDNPISGGKLIVGWSDDNPQIMGQGNSPTQVANVPTISGTTYNTITNNARQGWKVATINGNSALPVPASTISATGAAWTDWIDFGVSKEIGLDRLYWRFWHPGQIPSTDYAVSYFSYDPNPSYGSGSFGTIVGDALRYDDGWKYANATQWDYVTSVMYTDADLVSNPNIDTVANAFNGKFSPSSWYIGIEPIYGPPGPSVRPWIYAEFKEGV